MDITDNKCYKNVITALTNARKQTSQTLSTISEYLDNFAGSEYNKSTEALHTEWIKSRFELQYPYYAHVVADYSEPSNFLIDQQTLAEEMPKIYTTLMILNRTLTNYIEYRKNNMDRVQFDLNYNPTKLKKINEFWQIVYSHIERDLEESKSVMSVLNIELPKVEETTSVIQEKSNYHWLFVREHLGVMQLLFKVYTIFLEQCLAQK